MPENPDHYTEVVKLFITDVPGEDRQLLAVDHKGDEYELCVTVDGDQVTPGQYDTIEVTPLKLAKE